MSERITHLDLDEDEAVLLRDVLHDRLRDVTRTRSWGGHAQRDRILGLLYALGEDAPDAPNRGRVTLVADYLREDAPTLWADDDDLFTLAAGIVNILDTAAHGHSQW